MSQSQDLRDFGRVESWRWRHVDLRLASSTALEHDVQTIGVTLLFSGSWQLISRPGADGGHRSVIVDVGGADD